MPTRPVRYFDTIIPVTLMWCDVMATRLCITPRISIRFIPCRVQLRSANLRSAMLRRIYESRSRAIKAPFASITRLAHERKASLLLLLG